MEYNSFGEADVYKPLEELLEEQRIKQEELEKEKQEKVEL
jgi:hypothetical protein